MKSKETVKKRIINIDYEKNKISWFYYMPLFLIVGFVPLIVYGKYVNLNGTTQALFWTGQNELLDFFSYWKSRWVIFLTVTALITYAFLFITKKLPFKKQYKYYIPLVIYAIFVILSTIFAIDVPTALNGFMDMYQGMWVLLSYALLTFLVINFVNSERDVKLFLYVFIFLIIAEGLLGIGQYFGFDIFNTKLGNHLIIPSGVQVDGGLNFNFGKHTIYGTLFNTNFVGSFAALMLPMAVVFFITSKTTKKRIIAGIALTLSVFTWIGCNSRAGYIGVVTALIFTIIILRKNVVRYWKVNLAICLLGIISLVGFNYISGGVLVDRLSSMNMFKEIDNIKNQNTKDDVFRIDSIKLGRDTVNINTTYINYFIKIDDNKLYVVDEKGIVLPMEDYDDEYLFVNMTGYNNLKFKIEDNYPGFEVTTVWPSNKGLKFYITVDGVKIIGIGNKIVTPIEAEAHKWFVGFEKFASNRGYIWGRTIPLLDKYLFIGSGADNYPLAFPQDDYIAKLNIDMPALTIVDKPHNMYLQIAINTGVISLIALLALWSMYIVLSIRLYCKIALNSFDEYMGLACFLAVIGYLTAGMFNDHIISVAPIFWIILGIGISINIRLKKKEDNNV